MEVPAPAPGSYDVGPFTVVIAGDDMHLRWSVIAHEPVAVDAIAFVWNEGAAGDAPRLFSQGYQSWSPTRTFRTHTLGEVTYSPRGCQVPIPAGWERRTGTWGEVARAVR